jgi:hypothetical protein
VTTWETPVGSVQSRRRTHLSRGGNAGRSVVERAWIQRADDLGPVLFAIEDEELYPDYVSYDYLTYDLGQDCLIKVAGPSAPYEASYAYFDECTPQAADNWRTAQRDHPDRFAHLLEALEKREQKRLRLAADSPGEVVCLRGLSGRYGPEQFQELVVPFLNDCAALLHEKGKILCLKTSATNLSSFKDLIPLTGVDVIDGFVPPPVGDLSIPEARSAWGEQTVLWVDFPAQIFRAGAEATKKYTLELLESDPSGALVLGMTTIGTSSIVDDRSEQAYRAGMEAIMDAIDEAGGR